MMTPQIQRTLIGAGAGLAVAFLVGKYVVKHHIPHAAIGGLALGAIAGYMTYKPMGMPAVTAAK